MVAAGAALSAFTDPEEVRFDSGTGDRSSAPERTPATRATAGNPTPRRSLAAIVVHPSLSVASQGVRLAEALVRGPVPSRLWSCFGAAGGHEDALAHWRLHFQSIGRRPQCIEKALAQVNKTPGRRLQNIFDRRNLGTDLKIRPACGIVEPAARRPRTGSLISGVADVDFIGTTLYALPSPSREPRNKATGTLSSRGFNRSALDIGKSALFRVIRDSFDPRPSVKPAP